MRIAKSILPVFFLTAICGCGTTGTDQQHSAEQSDSKNYIHIATKFSFPESVGTFRRGSIRKYDRDGKNVGVGYNCPIPIASTVYVYPAPKDFSLLPAQKNSDVSRDLLEHHFKECKQEIFRAHPDAKLIEEGGFRLTQGANQFDGNKAVVSSNYKFGFANEDSISELYLFMIEPGAKFMLSERYFVKFRITYPISQKARAESEVKDFMTSLAWPVK